MKTKAVILLAAGLLFLPACRGGRSREARVELARGEEQSRAIEQQAAMLDEGGNDVFAQVPAPRFAAEAEDMPLSGEVVDGVRVIKMAARSYEFDPARIVVDSGERVRLEISSDSVVHGFALWGFEIVRRLEPDETTVIEFEAAKPGQYHFACSEYCGPGCVNMRGDLYVRDPKPGAPAGASPATAGR